MPFCPTCRSEYREGVARCTPCAQPLVPELSDGDEYKGERLRDAAKRGEASPIMRAGYPEACQMVELLQAAGLDAMVIGDPASCGKGGPCSHFLVAVLQEDVAAAVEVVRGEQTRLVEADDASRGANLDAMVDLDAEGQKSCPACGAAFDGAPQECPDCGLYLGVA